MTLRFPDRCGETGCTYSTTGPKVELSASALTGLRTFADAVTDSDLADDEETYVTVKKDDSNWVVWRVTFDSTATPDTLTRVKEVSAEGTISDTDSVDVWVTVPEEVLHSLTLPQVADSANSNVDMVANRHYRLTMAGFSANRNRTLPLGNPGDRLRITTMDGDADYAAILLGAATVTINGGSAATEWSRIFIANETVEFVATSTTNWQVAVDGRIPCDCWIYDSSNTSWASGVITQPNFNNTQQDNANVADLTNDAIKIRRDGSLVWSFSALSDPDFSSTEAIPGVFGMYNQAATALYSTRPSGCNSVTRVAFELGGQITVSVSDVHIYPKIRQGEGNTNFYNTSDGSVFQIKEILK